MRFSNWPDTAAKVYWLAGCTGPISLRRNVAPLDELAHEEGVKIPWNRPAAPRSSKSSASISSECRARTAGW
jgi:hypothetical protein